MYLSLYIYIYIYVYVYMCELILMYTHNSWSFVGCSPSLRTAMEACGPAPA